MRHGCDSGAPLLRRLVLFNLALLLCAATVGWTVSSSRAVVAVPRALPLSETDGRFIGDAVYVLTMNLRVVGTLLVGACTLGLLTVGQLVWLGFSLGHGLSALSRGPAGTIPLVMRYIPFEFLAFVLTASVAQRVAWMTVRSLAVRERVQPGGAAALLGVAILLLVLAAAVEAWVTPAIGVLAGALP